MYPVSRTPFYVLMPRRSRGTDSSTFALQGQKSYSSVLLCVRGQHCVLTALKFTAVDSRHSVMFIRCRSNALFITQCLVCTSVLLGFMRILLLSAEVKAFCTSKVTKAQYFFLLPFASLTLYGIWRQTALFWIRDEYLREHAFAQPPATGFYIQFLPAVGPLYPADRLADITIDQSIDQCISGTCGTAA